jgi:hypothetical protein
MLFVFAVPNTIPVPPGVSGVLGAPWLPAIIVFRSFARADFARILTKIGPWLEKAERLVGALTCILAIVLFLPIPLGNMLPAIAICILALGLIQQTGSGFWQEQ